MSRGLLLSASVIMLCSLATSDTPEPEQHGAVSGRVLDELGNPASDVNVCAHFVTRRPFAAAIPCATTGTDGFFKINHLTLGKYVIGLEKQSEGYPDTSFRLYRKGAAVEVIAQDEQYAKDLTLRLGPKAATLTGAITDAMTGAPVNASVTLWRLGHLETEMGMSLPADYRLLIPADTNVGISFKAQGYEP